MKILGTKKIENIKILFIFGKSFILYYNLNDLPKKNVL